MALSLTRGREAEEPEPHEPHHLNAEFRVLRDYRMEMVHIFEGDMVQESPEGEGPGGA